MIELYVFWIIFSILEGIEEGGILAKGGALVERPYDIHAYFVLNRIYVSAYLIYIYGFDNLLNTGLFLVALAASFPFWHDGSYYTTRRKIDYPTYHFFSESKTTTAKISLGAVERVILFVVSVAIIAFLQEGHRLAKMKTVFVNWF